MQAGARFKASVSDGFIPSQVKYIFIQLWVFLAVLTFCFLATGKMSRSDYPPDYEESRGPHYGGTYPQPPPYGFPGYGGPQPGQPSAPYPTDPNTPLFSGQPGGYPGGPYPGQPYHGGPPGAGYPNPPPMPPIIPPTIPSDVLSSGEYFPRVSS